MTENKPARPAVGGEPAPGAAPEPVTETWTYGGIRAHRDGKKWPAWVDPVDEEHSFAPHRRRILIDVTPSDNWRVVDDALLTSQPPWRGLPDFAGILGGRDKERVHRDYEPCRKTLR